MVTGLQRARWSRPEPRFLSPGGAAASGVLAGLYLEVWGAHVLCSPLVPLTSVSLGVHWKYQVPRASLPRRSQGPMSHKGWGWGVAAPGSPGQGRAG